VPKSEFANQTSILPSYEGVPINTLLIEQR